MGRRASDLTGADKEQAAKVRKREIMARLQLTSTLILFYFRVTLRRDNRTDQGFLRSHFIASKTIISTKGCLLSISCLSFPSLLHYSLPLHLPASQSRIFGTVTPMWKAVLASNQGFCWFFSICTGHLLF